MRYVPDADESEPRYHSRTPVRTATEGARVATELAARYEAEHPEEDAPPDTGDDQP